MAIHLSSPLTSMTPCQLVESEETKIILNLSSPLYLFNKYLREHLLNQQEINFDMDSIIKDYLILLKYYPDRKEANTNMCQRIFKDLLRESRIEEAMSYDIYCHFEVIFNTIYYQLRALGYTLQGELDYRYVRMNSVQLSYWQDEYMPVFTPVNEINMDSDYLLESKQYVYIGE